MVIIQPSLDLSIITLFAVATISETYALYAGGKIGIIQEFYVIPEFRSSGVGSKLLDAIRIHGVNRNWSCIELCTPPLPEFERTVAFYQTNGLLPVGGRKMRQNLNANVAKLVKSIRWLTKLPPDREHAAHLIFWFWVSKVVRVVV